jgi:membrane-associated phospholipid phosphatase
MRNPSSDSSPVSPAPRAPFHRRLTAFAFWAIWVGVAFFGVYPAMNWLTSLRGDAHALFFAAELGVPFVPEFVWIYLSMYALFFAPPFFLDPAQLKRLGQELITATLIAGVAFLLLPARLGFARVLPDDPFYRELFAGLFSLDHPHNLVPSLHVVYSAAIALAIFRRVALPGRIFLASWLALLMASTLLVHQHHAIDVVTGAALVLLVAHFWEARNEKRTSAADGAGRRGFAGLRPGGRPGDPR